jgi:phage-related tail fiber protein
MAFRTALNVKLKSELYNQIINTDQMVIVPGESNWDDAEFRFYYWSADSTATDDGENVIKPNAIVDAGRYIKFTKTQHKSDWSASSGLAQILNKPSIGSVTSVGMSSSDLSISGGPITTSGSMTVNLNNTGITAGSYGILTIDSKGRATAGKRMETLQAFILSHLVRPIQQPLTSKQMLRIKVMSINSYE